jgi:DNA-binding NarL/FixJ family response regulator
MNKTKDENKIRVLIADDHGIMRKGLELIISDSEKIEIIAQVDTGLKAIEMARRLSPDIVLMDISMPGLNGIDAAKQIRIENPEIKIIALSAHANRHFVKDMLKAGASGYILKDSLATDLLDAIDAVVAGGKYLSPKVAAILMDQCISDSGKEDTGSVLDKLTLKERQVLQLLIEDKTTIQTAKLLHLSPKTIEARRLNMMKKLGVSSMVNLTKLAVREGLTSLDF